MKETALEALLRGLFRTEPEVAESLIKLGKEAAKAPTTVHHDDPEYGELGAGDA